MTSLIVLKFKQYVGFRGRTHLLVLLTSNVAYDVHVLILLCVIFLTYTLSVTVLTWWVALPKMFCNWYRI